MEVRVNKDIKEYKENMFFGLTLRQFIFSVLGCAVAVALYFALKDKLGLEVATWVCVLGVAPFAALGFLVQCADLNYSMNLFKLLFKRRNIVCNHLNKGQSRIKKYFI